MKRGSYLFILLLSISLVAATPSINFQNEEVQQDETILGTISTVGEFTKSISQEDILFFEGRRPTFFEFEIFPYNGTYYFYIYANREGNFTMKIEDVLYSEEDQLDSSDLEKPFFIETKPEVIEEEINESGNITTQNKTITKILQIKPGVIFTAQSPLIKLINKGNVELEINYGGEELTLASSETKEVQMTPTESFSYLNISSYKDFSVPIIYLSVANESPWSRGESELRPDKSLIHINLIAGQKKIENLTLFNFVEENITDIEITSEVGILEISKIEDLEAKTDETITLTFDAENEGFVGGEIIIEYLVGEEKKNITIPVNAYILSEGSSEEDFEISGETCEEKGGIFCPEDESCGGESTWTSDEPYYCCLGNCIAQDPKKGDEPSFGWLIGLIILIALGIIGFFIYRKYKKTKPQKPEEKLAETGKTYERRIKGGISRN
jgi:hypothetical protein